MIAIIDYKAGNLTSVERAVRKLGYPCKVTNKAGDIKSAERIIFPGVGAAGQAMADLKALGLDNLIREAFLGGKPILGICLGTQIILEYSEENDTTCLGLVPGRVRLFSQPLMEGDTRLKIPHMGWNGMKIVRPHPVFSGVEAGSEFYFVHSYYPVPADDNYIAGLTGYGREFASAVAYKNLVALQCHPEKSGRVGLKVLDNFCRWDGYAQ
ncbi:MAG: imidazole glycerol phosphate synthase subunit HisH [Desulfovibrionales bacterium]|nr:imidazole glycerol phosphate synthase subunit HisH [Desulfovibrionales bacterium]